MRNPDRDVLDQIDQAWDERVRLGSSSTGTDADGFGETIDALHQADLDARPSDEFRRRLRRELIGEHAGARSNQQGGDFTFDADDVQGDAARFPQSRKGGVPETVTDRRWWANHLAELAAMILILIVAIAGAAWWQSGGDDGPSQPGASGDDTRDEAEIIATPVPSPEGIWADLTFAEAQAVTPFDLVMPGHIPDGYEPGSIRVANMNASPDADAPPRDDGEDWVFAVIPLDPVEGDGPQIELLQSNYRMPLPGMPLPGDEPPDDPTDGTWDEDTQLDELVLDGVEVNRIVRRLGDVADNMMYAWGQDAMGMMVSLSTEVDPNAPDESGVSDYSADLEAMIESIVAQRTSDEEPPQPPDTTVESESESETSRQPEVQQVLSFEEAQERTPFDLVDPRTLQDTFEFDGVMVNEPPSEGDRLHTTMLMHSADEDGSGFEFIQENARSQPPSLDSGTESVGPDGEPDDVENPDAAQEEIDIDGLTVTRTIQYNGAGDEMTIYNWHQDGLGMSIFAVTEVNQDESTRDPTAVIPAEDLDAFVRAIIEARASDTAPEQPDNQTETEGADVEPDPNSITLEEARQAVSFDLVDVSALPADLRPIDIDAVRYENGSVAEPYSPDANDLNRVHIHLATMPDREPTQIVEMIQTTEEIPNPGGDEFVRIDGRDVERVTGKQGSAIEVAYIWQVGDVNVGLLVTTVPQNDETSLSDFDPPPLVTEEDMVDFVRSTLP